jgi:amino acid adenylation domain-containing protein
MSTAKSSSAAARGTTVLDHWTTLSAEKRAYLRRLLRGRGLRDVPVLPRPADAGPLPLSFGQQRLWFLDRMLPGTSSYNMDCCVPVPSPVDVGALQCAVNEVVRRHEVLRTTFREEDGQPVQIISAPRDATLPIFDLRSLPLEEREAEALRRMTEEAQRPLDLAVGPLVRSALLLVSETENWLLLTMHHIVSDAWSMDVLFHELSVLYEAFCLGQPSPLPGLPVQYADYALWQREWLRDEVLEEYLSFWRNQLEGAKPLDLPADRSRPPVLSFRGLRHTFRVPAAAHAAMVQLANRETATLFMVYIAGFLCLLSRYTGQFDIMIGCPSANRSRQEIEGLIGFFVNTLVFRCDLGHEPTFVKALERVRETALRCYRYDELPFERLVEELQPVRDTSLNPLFQISFQLQAAASEAESFEKSDEARVYPQRGTSIFDLAMNLYGDGGHMSGLVEFNTDLFDLDTIERMVSHFMTLIESAGRNPDLCVSELQLLSESEHRLVVEEWNATDAWYPADCCAHHLFEQRAALEPERPAVLDGIRSFSYRQLNVAAERLARMLRDAGCSPGKLVVLLLNRSAELVLAQLAVWKCRAAFVPLESGCPPDRLPQILQETGAPVLVTNGPLAISKGPSLCVLDVQSLCVWEGTDESQEGFADAGSTSSDLAYVIYTSGSTGGPKGVEVPHRGLMNLISWHNRAYHVTAEDCASQLASVAFDASIWEIWPYLIAGATIDIVDEQSRIVPRKLLEWMAARRTTISFLPTPLAEMVLAEPMPKELSLRALLVGGDRLRRAVLGPVPFRIFNNYGPTECSVVATWTAVDSGSATKSATMPVNDPPIGRPVSNVRAYVLNAALNPQPPGVPGELYLSGDSLARGYLGRPDLTARQFLPDPFRTGQRMFRTGDLVRLRKDGQLVFLGRHDHQVKVRGYRIELGEIEWVLNQQEEVQGCVVDVRAPENGEARLVAYVVVPGEKEPESGLVARLKKNLSRQLPEYMVPSGWVVLEQLPITANGKVDRAALKKIKIKIAVPAHTRPRTATEQGLAEIWSRLLSVSPVGAFDHFFDLGGHSLLAAQMVSQVRVVFGVDVSLVEVFQSPVLAELASYIDRQPQASASPAIEPVSHQPNAPVDQYSDQEVDALLDRLLSKGMRSS